jgi:hypothetical protein
LRFHLHCFGSSVARGQGKDVLRLFAQQLTTPVAFRFPLGMLRVPSIGRAIWHSHCLCQVFLFLPSRACFLLFQRVVSTFVLQECLGQGNGSVNRIPPELTAPPTRHYVYLIRDLFFVHATF